MFVPPEEFDDYVITRELGRGQMGQVYLAEDAMLARPVAIKFIAGTHPDQAARQRFLMEARTAARIQHPNVVGVYRVGELDGRPYIVSELVRGTQLGELATPVTWTKALDIAIDLARGLAAAHRRGVVHCDIKPGNAMVTSDGVAKLVDFGLARVVHDGDEAHGVLVGTPDYMAPEIWAGRPPSRRSDVYSLGAVIFELLVGAPPFADREPSELGRAGRAPDVTDRVAGTDPRLARVVARCLEVDPELRFPSGEELREALELLHPSRVGIGPASGQNPYRGLRPFESAQRGVFFGRSLEVGAIIERMRTDSIVIVAGDSGVGKSSLCRAGVIPAIVDGALGDGRTWETLTMIPGRRPLLALATALGDASLTARCLEDPDTLPRELHRRARDKGVVLFVDQMEELVTVGDPDEVAALDTGLARVSEGVAGVKIITTLRADFLSRIATLPRLGRELSRLLCFVGPLPPERIRDVITGPAAATGLSFESDDMISTLVDATAQAGGGGLPLLSFALAELWEARDRDRSLITTAALVAMGGVAGALARHGDAVLAAMPAADRAHARRVLLRLVTSLGTRVRRTEAELSVSAHTRSALDALVKGRLLVVHDGDEGATFELAHEVLVGGWGTLRDWLEADADDRARRERLATAATEWARNQRTRELTWRGARLLEVQALDAANLTTLEREFIAASARAGRGRTWRRRIAVAGAVGLAVAGVLVQRHLARADLDDDVAVEVDAATALVADARDADSRQRATSTLAYAEFDGGATEAAEQLWQRVLADRDAAERAYSAAGGRLETALALDPERADLRALLADVLYERAVLAETQQAVARREELVARLAAYDADGSRRMRWNEGGRLEISAPESAQLFLDGRPVGRQLDLPRGSYQLEARAPGREPVVAPVVLGRGVTRLSVAMVPAGSVPRGYVYVPGGTFLTGSNADENTRRWFLGAPPLHSRSTGPFLIARTEVTVEDWLAFVEAQPVADQAALVPAIPAKLTGGMAIERSGATWRATYRPRERTFSAIGDAPLEYTGRTTHARQNWRRFPITGITALDAERYAAWLDATGRVRGARLCTELEWERAARGADGRPYPAGDTLDDANIDVTYGQELMGLDEVGSHPGSISPFGLVDMSGNAFEWTRTDRGTYALHGGSYFHDRVTANLANRADMTPDLRDIALGVRLCAPAPDEQIDG